MNVSWLLEPVTQVAVLCGIVGIGLIGSLTLWVSVRMEARAARNQFEAFRLFTEETIKQLSAGIDGIQATPAPNPIPPVMTVQGLNLTNRTKALRMHHRGESTASIAGALSVQQEEIDLLLKLDRLLEAPAV
jgi:hypothetical protein